MNESLPLPLEPLQRRLITHKVNRFIPAHAMPMVVAMGIVKTEHPAVVTPVNGMVDISQVVSGYLCFTRLGIPPDLVTEKPPTRFGLEFEALLLQ